MKELKTMQEITATNIKDGFSNRPTELIFNNFKIGFNSKFYVVGSLFDAGIYGYFDTVRELKMWLSANITN